MSLIHWWPLNGNLNDYGTHNATLTNGGVTINNNGKIGKCYSFAPDTGYVYTTATDMPRVLQNGEFSIACWAKTSASTAQFFLSIGSTTADHCLHVGLRANQQPFIGFHSDDYNSTYTCNADTWYHFAFIVTNHTQYIYVNGNLIGSRSGAGNLVIDTDTVYLGRYVATGYGLNGVLNDVRVYDHALSITEVKDLAKGLILHYNFEDPWIESTINLISSVNSNNARLPKVGNGVDLQTAAGDAYCDLALSVALVNGSTYTLSFDISNLKSGEMISFGFYDNGMHNTTSFNRNGRATIIFTAWNTASSLIFDDSTRTNTTIVSLRNFQLEQKDHATPYVNGSRTAGIVYDNSGYGYNGTVNGNLQITADSSLGQHAAVFGSNIYIESPTLPDFYQATYSFWIKLNGNSQAYRAIFIPKNNPTGAGIWLSLNTEGYGLWAYQGSNSPSYCIYGTLLSDNTWYLCTHVFNNGVGQWYLNGQPITGTTTYTTRSYITGGVYTIGDSYTGSSWSGTPFDGEISDFKIYATALSAADILTEYQRKAAIYRDGTLITGEFVESDSLAILPLTNTYFTGAVFDTTNNVITVSGQWVGFQFANSLFTLNKCYHLSFDAQYQSGTFLNILGHSNNFAVNAYLDGKKLTTAWSSVPSGAVAEENVMLDGKWHHFDLYIKYQSQNDSYGPWVQVNRAIGSGSALVWFTNLMMEEIATMTTMPTVQMPTKTEMIQSAGFEEYADHVYVSHTGLIGSSHIVEK